MNWKILCDQKYDSAWNFIFNNIGFNPYGKMALVKFPIPRKYFDISAFYNDRFTNELYENLHSIVQQWFKEISYNREMYALNWQHECYSFIPNLPYEKNNFNEWLIPVFPNGDYLFFLTKDFENGLFADGIHLKIILWGKDLIDVSSNLMPDMLLKSNISD